MKLPNSFKYKGRSWKVIQEKNLHADDGAKCMGLCDTDLRTIYIESSLSKKEKARVFLHELFHALVHETHIPPNIVLSEDIEDILAEAFADIFETLLKVGWR